MSRIVLKFGGTSLANIERIRNVAQLIASEVHIGNQVAVVVSAMAGVTDQLISRVYDSSECPPDTFEYDVVVSTGEQITCGLLAVALQNINVPARSWLAWQLPILTNDTGTKNQQVQIMPELILENLMQGYVPVVTGFQGIDHNQRITTLGRGGSDMTAIALAHAIKAEHCDIYTDVDGVFTADPRIIPKAYKLDEVSYVEMLEFARHGAKVLQSHSVEIAMKHKVKVRILSSFNNGTGTWIVDERKKKQYSCITGIAINCNTAKIVLTEILGKPNLEEDISCILEKAHIYIDMMTKNPSKNLGELDISFTISLEDRTRLESVLTSYQNELGFKNIKIDTNVAKIAIICNVVKSPFDIAKNMLNILKRQKINIQMISQSPATVIALINKENATKSMELLHSAFGLDRERSYFQKTA